MLDAPSSPPLVASAHGEPSMVPSSPPLGPSDTYQVDSDDFITDEESIQQDEYNQLVTEGKSRYIRAEQ